jgi:preprotein translocase subunit SecG
MVNVILAIHLIIAAAMIALILVQKTEGNAAGGGFSASSATAMMQPRSRPNALGRATGIAGLLFFVTSLGLALMAKQVAPPPSILNTPAGVAGQAPKVTDILPPADATTPAAPAEAAPAAPAPAAPAPAAPPAVPTVPNN